MKNIVLITGATGGLGQGRPVPGGAARSEPHERPDGLPCQTGQRQPARILARGACTSHPQAPPGVHSFAFSHGFGHNRASSVTDPGRFPHQLAIRRTSHVQQAHKQEPP